jgi:hypothetical protein
MQVGYPVRRFKVFTLFLFVFPLFFFASSRLCAFALRLEGLKA